MSMQEENINQKSQETQTKMIRGSAWLSAGSIISRLMGAIYIIPWYMWMGEHGNIANSLYGKGYNIYSLFLMIATAGIPGAIAKQISHYNSMNEYGVSQRLFRRSLSLMGLLGLFFALFMYVASPFLASWSGGGEDLVRVMRSLSWAVLIFPSMSVVRGYFQGFHDMAPSAISQIVEQFARVFYMLLTAFIIMKVRNGDYVSAVVQSTFAAFIGMLASFAVLIWYMKKQAPIMRQYEKNSNHQIKINANQLVKEMLVEAVPFIIIGSGITFFKLVDQFTFDGMMRSFTNYSDFQLDDLFAIFNLNVDKLTMIVISFATSISFTSLPLVTEAYTQKNKKMLSKLITDNLQLFFFIMFPATLGLVVLAYPLYTVFYHPSVLGSNVLIEAAYLGLFLGMFMFASFVLQGLYDNQGTIKYLVIGLLAKLILQYPCIRLFEIYGPLLATAIGFGITCFLMLRKILRLTQFNLSLVCRRTLLILILSVGMAVVTWVTKWMLQLFLSPDSKTQALVIVALSACVGVVVYAYFVLKIRLADRLLGSRVASLRSKLGIK